jgi:thiamine transport system permease protein
LAILREHLSSQAGERCFRTLDIGARDPMRPTRKTDTRVLAGIVALGAISLLIGGAFVGLVAEGARDLSGAYAAIDGYQ